MSLPGSSRPACPAHRPLDRESGNDIAAAQFLLIHRRIGTCGDRSDRFAGQGDGRADAQGGTDCVSADLDGFGGAAAEPASQPNQVAVATTTTMIASARVNHISTNRSRASRPGSSINRPPWRSASDHVIRRLRGKTILRREADQCHLIDRTAQPACSVPRACRTTALCASTVSAPPPGTSSAGVASSGPVKTTTCQEAPNSFGGSVNSSGS